ncbi:flagellar biosynthetic protein FliR [Fluviibacterium sp. DFM31]|uniref:Flagellar biosynthetic protein FliR n=1 Tax=Meridianimarinicoccus marinus TaxID=3231483 RepID=A0ABV3L312_9RHOB
MNDILQAMAGLGGPWLWSGWAVFLRVGSAMMFLPAFGEQTVPVRLRLATAGAFTVIIVPIVSPDLSLPAVGLPGLLHLTLTETLSGLTLGFSIRALVWALHVAGTMAAQATSLSQLLGGGGIDPQPAMARLLTLGGLALAATAGLHLRITEALVRSYDTLPAGTVPLAADLSRFAVARVAELFGTAFSFAAPFLIASLIYNLALGVINRAMPQLMVAFVGAPAITAGGLGLLLLTAPRLLDVWLRLLNLRLAAPFEVLP